MPTQPACNGPPCARSPSCARSHPHTSRQCTAPRRPSSAVRSVVCRGAAGEHSKQRGGRGRFAHNAPAARPPCGHRTRAQAIGRERRPRVPVWPRERGTRTVIHRVDTWSFIHHAGRQLVQEAQAWKKLQGSTGLPAQTWAVAADARQIVASNSGWVADVGKPRGRECEKERTRGMAELCLLLRASPERRPYF